MSMHRRSTRARGSHACGTLPQPPMTAAAPAATVLPSMTLQPNVAARARQVAQRKAGHREGRRQDPERQASPEKTAPEKILASAAALHAERRHAAVAVGAVRRRCAPPRPRAPTCAWCRILRRSPPRCPPRPLPPRASRKRRWCRRRARRSRRPCRRSPCSPWPPPVPRRAGRADRRAHAAPRRTQLPRAGRGRQPADAHLPAEQAAAVRHLARSSPPRAKRRCSRSPSNIST